MKKTSAAGLAFIAKEEGEVLHVYPDQAGVPTIGVGHALLPGEAYPNGITHDEAFQLLSHDVAVAEHSVNGSVPNVDDLAQNAFDALVSFTFNEGGAALLRSSVLAFIKTGDMQSAARGFLLWDKRRDKKTGQLVTDAGLFARRCAERDLFLKPDDDDNPY